MNQDQNYITIEMNFRFQMKDYRLIFGVKRIWITMILVIAVKTIIWLATR